MSRDPVVRALLEDAAGWRLLGLLLERPHGSWSREVAALGPEVGDPDLRRAADAAAEARESEYLAVLGPGSRLSGREAGHDHRIDPGQLLSELEAHYDAFHFRPRTDEPPDHVSVEAGFVGYLRLKEAFARATGRDEEAEVTARVTAAFLDGHVSLWAQPLAEGLAGTEIDHLRLAAHAAFRRVGPPRRPTLPAPDPAACGLSCALEPGPPEGRQVWRTP